MKKSKLKKLLSTILCAAMVTTILAGCQKQNGAKGKSGKTKLHIMYRVNPQVDFNKNSVFDEVEKETNLKLVIDAPPINNYSDRLQIVMASGDMPDIVMNPGAGDANYQKWASNGVLADITDKIKKYPNLMKNITEDMWNSVRTDDGKIYCVPKTNLENYWGYSINQKWLDKLGLKAPTTLQEFEDVCKAFTTKDPDGDGKNDTYGLSSVGTGTTFLQSAFNLSSGIKDVDGQYKMYEKFTGYIPYLTYLRKLYKEGVYDPEFFTNTGYADRDKLLQNKVGIISTHQVGVMSMIALKPGAENTFTYHAPIKDESGKSNCYITLPTWGAWMISKDTSNLDAVLKFLDWGNSEEGFKLLSLGVKGVDYKDYNSKTKEINRTPEQTQALATKTSSYTTISYALGGQSAIVEGADTSERLKLYNDQYNAMIKSVTVTRVPTVTAVNCPKYVNFGSTNPDDVKAKDNKVVQYVRGEITLEQFKNYLETKYYPAMADAEKEYVNYMNKLGK